MSKESGRQLRIPYFDITEEVADLRYEGKGLIVTGIGSELIAPLVTAISKEVVIIIPFIALGALAFLGSYFKFKKARKLENSLNQQAA